MKLLIFIIGSIFASNSNASQDQKCEDENPKCPFSKYCPGPNEDPAYRKYNWHAPVNQSPQKYSSNRRYSWHAPVNQSPQKNPSNEQSAKDKQSSNEKEATNN